MHPSLRTNTSASCPRKRQRACVGRSANSKSTSFYPPDHKVYPMGLNGGDQSVIIDILGPLHSGSSVTTDKHPYIRIDIPSPTIEEQDYANLHTTLAVAMPKTPWKPKITLQAEVGNQINRGMTEDFDCEPEHSAMAKGPATEAETSPPQKMEMPAQSLDTPSQVSAAEMEASMESNPICDSPTAVAYSSHNDSPTMDLPELQANVNLAVNHMLSIKRSLDLERQWVIWDFETSLHQQEAEEATTNERAKIVHSRKDLNAKVKCAKAVMKVKYNYRVAIQEARAIRCSEHEESEATYLEALSENVAAKSLHCTTLHREHARHMDELEEQALDGENKSCQDFLLAHQAILHHAPVPEREPTFLLPHSIRAIIIITSIHSVHQGTPGRGATTFDYFSQDRAQMVPMAKKVVFLGRCIGRHVHR